ncbi:MAG: DinB family protein [Bacteroidota bacterium]
MLQDKHLEKIHQDLCLVRDKVKTQFGGLSETQFNWKPEAKKWSIAECMDHLLIVFSRYEPNVEKKMQEAKKDNAFLPYKSTFTGRLFMRFVNPDKIRKTSAPGFLKPTPGSTYPLSRMEDYLAYLEKVDQYIDQADGMALNKIRIASSIGPILKFSLGDYFLIESMHNRRHLKQMLALMENPQFPK